MSENILQTLQSLVQDVIAPDVRELKVRLTSLEKQMDVRFDAVNDKFAAVDGKFAAMDGKFAAMNEKMDVQFRAIMAAIGESKAQSELTTFRLLSALSERVAVLEAQRAAHQ
jgi:hypothetical protein